MPDYAQRMTRIDWNGAEVKTVLGNDPSRVTVHFWVGAAHNVWVSPSDMIGEGIGLCVQQSFPRVFFCERDGPMVTMQWNAYCNQPAPLFIVEVYQLPG